MRAQGGTEMRKRQSRANDRGVNDVCSIRAKYHRDLSPCVSLMMMTELVWGVVWLMVTADSWMRKSSLLLCVR